jgi:hypothetical protein
VVSDFSNGGTVSTITIGIWVGGTNGNATKLRTDPTWSGNGPLQLLFNAAAADCAAAAAGDLACAIENSGNTSAPWRYLMKGALTTSANFCDGGVFRG